MERGLLDRTEEYLASISGVGAMHPEPGHDQPRRAASRIQHQQLAAKRPAAGRLADACVTGEEIVDPGSTSSRRPSEVPAPWH